MALAQAINDANPQHLDDLVGYVMAQFQVGSDNGGSFELADAQEVAAAFKAWAYMNLNAPGGE